MPGESRPHRLQVAALRDGLLDPAQPLMAGGEIRHIHSGEGALAAVPTGAKRSRRGHRPAANTNRRNRLAI
jgi:hypothetical protein